jgi:hypothetical protein
VLVAFLPLAIIGLLFGKAIKAYLFNAPVVATAFIVGGLVILWAERRDHRIRVESIDDLSLTDAIKLGFAQALALIPGTSRSGATIIGGLLFGLSRRAATEFSFFLAMPTLIGAGIYQLYKERALLSFDDLGMWVVGFVASFVSAFWAVRGLLRYISTHDFSLFAWYRIAFGIVVLVTWHYRRDFLEQWLRWRARGFSICTAFCSSPASWKARLLGERLATAGLRDRFSCPTLSPVPLAAIAYAPSICWPAPTDRRRWSAVRSAAITPPGWPKTRSARSPDQPGSDGAGPARRTRRDAHQLSHRRDLRVHGRARRTTARARDARRHAGALPVAGRDRRRSARLPSGRRALCRQPPDHPRGGRSQLHALPRAVPQIIEFCGL